ncbi:hypothetical protein BDA99DRAFT_130742 [Phascolomyces articulosus]|uniref:CAP-Gly domain-containing protein n=1 Tax=Phascolomyces articulosus TaxID=60185 RepID=A0AAD5KQ95_9FUNG|nr:hypothetical protein BDA99DRAFT_130742 [Phascolomyces articulosus]
MSRIPGANSGIQPPTTNTKRLSRQPSLDLRRRKHHPDQTPPPPVPTLKSSKSSRLSRTSISSYDEVESPSSAISRYSLSSFGSAGTAMTSPRTSFTTSPKPTVITTTPTNARQRPLSKQTPTSPIQRSHSGGGGSLRLGDRVAVDSMGIVGTLQFLGTTQFKEGVWAGIQLDIVGTGKNDGSVRK